MWRIKVSIGVFWDGPEYELVPSRFRLISIARARLHLFFFPYRSAIVYSDDAGDE